MYHLTVFPVLSVLLQAANKVTELYDTIESVLVHIRNALVRFGTCLKPSTRPSLALKHIFLKSLIVILELIGMVKKYCDIAVKERQSLPRMKLMFGLGAIGRRTSM